jgi:hypothetical protein
MIVMRRSAFVALLLLLVAVSMPAAPGWAQTTQPTMAAAVADVRADFDNDGFSDLAIGAPTESLGTINQAGAVSVLYATPSGLTGSGSQLFTQNTPGVPGAAEPGDQFGSALTTGDFDHDGFADLAVGASLEDAGTIRDAGAVTVLYGSAGGLTTIGSQLFTQVAGAVEAEDRFGSALATGDFNNNGFADLAAGAPLENVGTAADAGAVSVLYGAASGLTASGGWTFTQVGGASEQGDRFGSALATGDFNVDGVADLGAGAPLEDVGSTVDAGAVSEIRGSASGLTTVGGRIHTERSSTGPQPGDQFGVALATGVFSNSGVTDLAVGVPGQDGWAGPDVGAVVIFDGAPGGLANASGYQLNQVGSSTSKPGDRFTSVLVTGDFDSMGQDDIAAGAPLGDVGSTVDAGKVGVVYDFFADEFSIRDFHQNIPGVAGSAEPGDHFGAALASR